MTRTPPLADKSGIRRRLRGFSRPAASIVLSGIVLVLALLAGAGWVIVERRNEAIANAERETTSLSLALAEHTSRTFQAVDVDLMNLAEKLERIAIASPLTFDKAVATPDVRAILGDEILDLKQVNGMNVIGADGRVLNTSGNAPNAPVNVAQRDYFRVLSISPDMDLFIGQPFVRPDTGAWTVVAARRLTAPNGDFMGIVTAVIALKYFEDFYRAVSPGAGDNVSLNLKDGTLLVRYPPASRDFKIGEPVRGNDGAPRSSVTAQAVRSGAAVVQRFAMSPVDGVTRLLSLRVLKDFPLVLVVARAETAITAEWRPQAMAIGGGALLAALALILGTMLLARQLTRREVSEAALAAALEHMSDGIIMIDHDHRVRVCNRHAIEMFDLPPELMAGHPLFDDVLRRAWETGRLEGGGKSLDETRRVFDFAATLSRQSHVFETRRPNGEVFEIHSNPLPGGGVVRTYTDVTLSRMRETALNAAVAQRDVAEAGLRRHRDDLEREVAERTRELAASKTRLSDAIEAIPEGFVLFDPEDRLVLCNTRFREIFALAEGEAEPGIGHDELFRRKYGRLLGGSNATADDIESFLRERQARRRAAGSALDAYEQQLADGRIIEIHDRRTADGGIVGLRIDVTEARRRQAAEREREKLAALGHLAGGVAHEINNLLQPALTFPELVMDRLPPDDAESREDLELVIESTRKARDIVRGILLYARKDEPVLTPLPFASEARAALAFVRGLLPPTITVVESGLSGEALAAINRTQLTQVLTNLIVNAAHAMKGRGTITVTLGTCQPDKREADALEIEAGRTYLTLAVADTGHGMDAATQKRIFEPFFTTKPIGEGTGLGLPVAYGILKSWKGATGLASTVGVGTVFTLYIPTAGAAAPVEQPEMRAVAA